jgi:hypothetical protein
MTTSATRTIDPGAYGFVPAAQIRANRAGPSPDPDAIDRLVEERDWAGISAFLAPMPPASERRFAAIGQLGNAAANEDGWLQQWIRAEPRSSTALAVLAESMVRLAWNIRTGQRAENVAPEQWTGFFRVLREVPEICARGSAADPADSAPFLALLNAARGLQWSNDRYRALCAEVDARAPHSFTAGIRSYHYWLPRWYGSVELHAAYVADTIAAAPLGTGLTILRIQALHDELRPSDTAARPAFYCSDAVNQALDHGIADAAAAEPGAVKVVYLRHWLAYLLRLAGRNAEALSQFSALGGYCGAEPWDRFKNPAAKFDEMRTQAVLAWEDAGRR